MFSLSRNKYFWPLYHKVGKIDFKGNIVICNKNGTSLDQQTSRKFHLTHKLPNFVFFID